MKPYNYFDDEEEQPQPSAHVRLAQLVAALQVNGAKLRRMVRRDEEIVEELRDYPNLRRAALKWLAVALFVLAVVIAISPLPCLCITRASGTSVFAIRRGRCAPIISPSTALAAGSLWTSATARKWHE